MLNEISIEILQRCPNRCIYCSSHSNPQATHIIPYDIIKMVIDGAKALGCKTVCLSGGEPLLHPHIIDIVSYIACNQMDCYIYTSGIYMDDANHYNFIPLNYIEAIRGMATKVIFNVEADTSELYDLIIGTNVGGFELMKKSITDCVSCGLNVETHIVPMKSNYAHLKAIFDMCYQLGVNKVSILRLVLQGRALENIPLVKMNSVESQEVNKLIAVFREEYKDKVRIGLPYSSSSCRIYCKAATGKINIRYDGNVYPCEVFKDDLLNKSLGCQPANVMQDSFINIYFKSAYLNTVRDRIIAFKKTDSDEVCYGQFKIEKL